MHSSGDQDRIVAALDRLHIELPSWGFANTGTRFGKYLQPAAAVTTGEKISDAGHVHALTGCCPTVALHVLWDFPGGLADTEAVAAAATAHGLRPGAINPNLFQDQEYKHGSFGNPSAAVRERALAHCRDSIAIARQLGSRDISMWFADGSNYPGTANIRARKRWFEECLAALHADLGPGQRLLVEYKPFEPAFYHTDVADWGMALLMARAAGPQAKVLVDTGHHYLSQNIEQIVAWLLAEGMLGGFHFNDRRYADDDLTIGSIDPYQAFRIFHEINFFEWETGAPADIAFVVDQSHNLKGKIESMIQTVVQAQSLVAKAALVDCAALAAAQKVTDLVRAESCLQDAFATDVRPIVREWRSARGRPADPMQAFRESGYLERITKERAGRPVKDPVGVRLTRLMSTPLLEVVSIRKAFAGVQALAGVSFDVRAGEVHALVGENGAGKSTLIRIMTGAETPDAGTLIVAGPSTGLRAGQSLSALDPASARAMGIAAIYQQPSLFPDLTVAENIALAIETGGVWRRVNRRARLDRARDLLARAGASIDPARLAATLSLPEQQLVEIARAIGADARIVIMDEPTASLGDHEVRHLFSVIRALRDAGSAVIYISHRLDEVFDIADRVTVLRDGAAIATRQIAEVDRAGLIAMMVGREVTQMYPPRRSAPAATETPAAPKLTGAHSRVSEGGLQLVRISNPAAGVRDVSLSIARGEIVGLAGLVGCGRSELAETIFGLTPARSGEIRIDEAVVRIDSPTQAIAHGIGYVPKDRRQHGVVPEMTVTQNTGLASLQAVSRAGLIRPAIERRAAEGFIGQLRIKTPSAGVAVDTLSGGNQQKVALARWLMTNPRVLILDEPTQGVDVGAKAEIHATIADLAARGVAILLISSELPELIGLCDRVAVMRAGTICGVLPGATADAAALLAMAVGQ